MLAFPSGLCYLFNYRLASKFGVSLRTIHYWRAWLIKHHLCHTFWQAKNRPRIVVHRYASFYAWLTEMALPRPTKKRPILPMSVRDKEARIRRMRRQLLGI